MLFPKNIIQLSLIRQYLFPGVLVAAVALSVVIPAWGQDDSSTALWQFYPPLKISVTGEEPTNYPGRRDQNQESMPEMSIAAPTGESAEYTNANLGRDPLFDSNTIPSWMPPRIEKPLVERPTYDYPNYDAPMYRLEPVRKAVEDQPSYVAPYANRPNYSMQYEEGPAEMAPTLAAPDYRGPNYVVKPYEPPAANAPTIDQSGTDYHTEEYKPPTYRPEEYRPPRDLPPEYMPPSE